MAFTVEDGSGLIDANSFVEVAEFTAYCADRGIDITGFADDTAIENALINGGDYLKSVYYGSWIGELLVDTQRLPFPRVFNGVSIYPIDIKFANITLALKENNKELLIDVGQRVVEEQVSSIKVKYSEYSDEQTNYTNVYQLVKPFLMNTSKVSRKIVRT